MTLDQWIALCVLGLAMTYVGARVAAAGWYRGKLHYHDQLMRNLRKETTHGKSSKE